MEQLDLVRDGMSSFLSRDCTSSLSTRHDKRPQSAVKPQEQSRRITRPISEMNKILDKIESAIGSSAIIGEEPKDKISAFLKHRKEQIVNGSCYTTFWTVFAVIGSVVTRLRRDWLLRTLETFKELKRSVKDPAFCTCLYLFTLQWPLIHLK